MIETLTTPGEVEASGRTGAVLPVLNKYRNEV